MRGHDKKASRRDGDTERAGAHKAPRQESPRQASPRQESPAHLFFIYKVGILRRLLDRYSSPAITDQFDLTVAEWRVLTQLYSVSPTTAWQLCLRVHADKAEISRACAGLVARGFANRRADPKDRRSVLLAITPRGERLHDAIVPLRQALQDELESALTRTETAELHRLLDKLIRHVSQRIGKAEEAEEAARAQPPVRSKRQPSERPTPSRRSS